MPLDPPLPTGALNVTVSAICIFQVRLVSATSACSVFYSCAAGECENQKDSRVLSRKTSRARDTDCVTWIVMTSRWSRRLIILLLCLDIVVKLTLCNNNDSGASTDHNDQPVNYRGSVTAIRRRRDDIAQLSPLKNTCINPLNILEFTTELLKD